MLKWTWLSVLVIVLDQLTKQIAERMLNLYAQVEVMPHLNLTLAYNKGAAFSFLSDAGGWQRWFFTALAIGVSVVILVWMHRMKSNERLQAIALALILGGALGNVIDRILFGHVIDFIDLYYQHYHWPAFNIADSAITIGASLIIIHALFFDLRKSNE
jgi:signal peptidase II